MENNNVDINKLCYMSEKDLLKLKEELLRKAKNGDAYDALALEIIQEVIERNFPQKA